MPLPNDAIGLFQANFCACGNRFAPFPPGTENYFPEAIANETPVFGHSLPSRYLEAESISPIADKYREQTAQR